MARPRNAGPGRPKCRPFPANIKFKRSYLSFERTRATRPELRLRTGIQDVSASLQCCGTST
eukprot:1549988-Rhodomonas_salina.1